MRKIKPFFIGAVHLNFLSGLHVHNCLCVRRSVVNEKKRVVFLEKKRVFFLKAKKRCFFLFLLRNLKVKLNLKFTLNVLQRQKKV